MLTRRKTAKKKSSKRRNPCLPCNPSTRATRFKRNPIEEAQLRYEIKEITNHICANLKHLEDAEFTSLNKMILYRDRLNRIYNLVFNAEE